MAYNFCNDFVNHKEKKKKNKTKQQHSSYVWY